MDCESPISDVVARLWGCTTRCAGYISAMEEYLHSSRNTMEELNNVGKDVKRRDEHAEEQQMRCTNEVYGWLHNVQVMEKEVNHVLQKADQEIQRKCFGTSPKNCWSIYTLGKIGSRNINVVNELKNKGRFNVVAERLPYSPVDERPMEKSVGLDRVSGEVWGWLEDEQVGIIGLYIWNWGHWKLNKMN